jgi:hypothetical protein
MIFDPIIATLSKIISLHDGIAEPAGEHILNALLTENITSLLSLPEEVTFTTKIDVPESVFVTYHSEVLNKLSDLLATKPAFLTSPTLTLIIIITQNMFQAFLTGYVLICVKNRNLDFIRL